MEKMMQKTTTHPCGCGKIIPVSLATCYACFTRAAPKAPRYYPRCAECGVRASDRPYARHSGAYPTCRDCHDSAARGEY